MSEPKTKFPVPINSQTWLFIAIPIFLGVIIVSLRQFQPIDEALVRLALGLPRGGVGFMTYITNLGTSGILLSVAVTWSVAELFFMRWDRAIVMIASTAVLPVYELVKIFVHRARPVTTFVFNAGLHGDSFPSGHSAGSFAIYVTLAYLLYRELPRPWSRVAAGFSVMLAVLIGFSRVYLGAHFPTDVVGGWLIASFVLLLIRYGLNKYEARYEAKV